MAKKKKKAAKAAKATKKTAKKAGKKPAKMTAKKVAKKTAAKKPAKAAKKVAPKKAAAPKKAPPPKKMTAPAPKKMTAPAAPKKVAVAAPPPSRPAPVAVRPTMPPPPPFSSPPPPLPSAMPLSDDADADDAVSTTSGGFDDEEDGEEAGDSDDDGPAPEPRAQSPPVRALHAGDAAPSFDLEDADGVRRRLDDFRGQRVVLFFYPRADTPGCTTEACGFREHLGVFAARDVAVLGISPDRAADNARFAGKYSLTFPLLSDPDGTIARHYGAWGLRSPQSTVPGALRQSFVIDEQGVLLHCLREVRPDRHAAEVLDLLDRAPQSALQGAR